MKGTENSIAEWLEPRLEHENLYLVDVKVLPGFKVQVFVDGDENITISQCATISRQLEAYLDEGDLVPENYTLEVSSPGMTSPLLLPRQYKKRMGRVLDITTNSGEKIIGVLKEINEEGILLEDDPPVLSKTAAKKAKPVELKQYTVLFSNIKNAIVQFKFK
jgi:ribosome maturation factor RimP